MKKTKKSLKIALISVSSLIALMSIYIFLEAEALAGEYTQNSQLLAKNDGYIRYDGIYQADAGERGWYYLRFYPNGKALWKEESHHPPAMMAQWFLFKKYKERRAQIAGATIGDFKLSGSDIELKLDQILYKGKFNKNGDFLTLSWLDSKTNKKISKTYWLSTEPKYRQRPEPLQQKKESEKAALLAKEKREKQLAKEHEKQKLAMEQEKDRNTEGQFVKGEVVTEITKYDQYGLYNDVLLKNKEGELVAKKLIMRSPYNPTQITGEVIRDVSTDKDIHYTEVEGNAKNPMWVCLDKDGNIVKKSGKPILVKPFQAIQRTEFEIEYRGAYKDKKYTIFYPCSNCASKTGIKDCVYVW